MGGERRRRNTSYLLRLWQAEHEGALVWRASLQSASDRFGRPGARRGFASLAELHAFPEQEIAAINYYTEARSEDLLSRSQCNSIIKNPAR